MCSRVLRDEDGRELTRLDLRYEGLKEAQERRFRGLVTYGSVVAAVAGLFVGFVHIGAAVIVPLMVVAHLLAIRFVLMRDACRYLGTSRRLITRWIIRLSILWGGALGYGAAVIPLVGSVFSTATFAGLTWMAHNYILWGLQREHSRMGTAGWERILLILLSLATFTVAVAAVVIAALLGCTGSYLLDLVQSG